MRSSDRIWTLVLQLLNLVRSIWSLKHQYREHQWLSDSDKILYLQSTKFTDMLRRTSRRAFVKRSATAVAGAFVLPQIVPSSVFGMGGKLAPSDRI
ncbi:MAG: twin-arginine translocation signal domain-containing protein, partial [Bacteroidales bacterium]